MDAILVKNAPATKTKATIIYKGGMGNVLVKHVYLLAHGRKKYAQYASAPFVHYVEKGKRKPQGFVQTYRPYLVILDGWQNLESQSMWGKVETNPVTGTTISQGKYSSFDERWTQDFEAATKLTGIIADYRDVDTYMPLERIAA